MFALQTLQNISRTKHRIPHRNTVTSVNSQMSAQPFHWLSLHVRLAPALFVHVIEK